MVNHAGRAIAVTEGFIGSTNDKTIVCWDATVEEIRTDKQYTEKTFDVCNEDGTTTTLKGVLLARRQRVPQVANPDGAHQVPAERERSPLFEEAGERAEGRGMLLRHSEGPLQDPEARHGVPRAGAHRQRVFHVLHLAQHAAHLRRNGRAGGKHALGQQCRGGDHVGDRAGGGL
ncbi:unnamed protein product [Ectocarpus sp. 6 AP-2014]